MEKKYPIGGYAPGDYWHKACKTCGKEFTGDKRAWNCEPCGEKAAESQPKCYPGIEYQSLFDYLSNEHGLTLFQSEMSDLIDMVHKFHPKPTSPRWVKAIERLPSENGGKYFVKFRESKCVCHYYNGHFQSIEWGLLDNNALIWLDETGQ